MKYDKNRVFFKISNIPTISVTIRGLFEWIIIIIILISVITYEYYYLLGI